MTWHKALLPCFLHVKLTEFTWGNFGRFKLYSVNKDRTSRDRSQSNPSQTNFFLARGAQLAHTAASAPVKAPHTLRRVLLRVVYKAWFSVFITLSCVLCFALAFKQLHALRNNC